ncbi:MAG: SGNH/GDSL hydrolase family protein [Clostridia bacterium]|nr:SGNH/GDSL hydrolase family protein [Clostridia bacterium]
MCFLTGRSVLVLGDSIMFGSGNDGYGPGEFLRDDFGGTLFKYCVGGARTGFFEGRSWIVEQLRQAIMDGVAPDYVLFDGMTNDCFKTDGENFDVEIGEYSSEKKGVDINTLTKDDSFSACFDSIVFTLTERFPDAKLLYVRNHNMGRREDAAQRLYGERAVQICRKWGVEVADVYSESGLDTFLPEHRDKYTADTYGWGRGDCTHPNREGYRLFYMPIIERKLRSL